MKLKKALPVRLRALWFGGSLVSSIWFLYWICYDVIVWNKALSEARLENYVGLTVFIALAILVAQVGKCNFFEKVTFPLQQNINKKTAENQQTLQREEVKLIEHLRPIQPAKEEATQMAQDSIIPSGCKFHLGYLHTHSKSVEIPDKCLECEHVVDCLSPTARTINARA